ncbi:hypothetical protein [Chryseobacterium gossypii]|uniref:hypothetical protein n=1 Tax=Chryseobacterium gossypii TaxID=3231602 RepID=UPI003524DA62
MKTKLLSLFSLLIGFLGFSQTEVYFNYDPAGNQIYRGPDSFSKIKNSSESKSTHLDESNILVVDEAAFWKQVRLYPVPVSDILTIDWTDKTDKLIKSVSLYQHSTIHWKFQAQNIPGLNKQLKINMTGYDWGVYVLQFTLYDGRVFSKNITKR